MSNPTKKNDASFQRNRLGDDTFSAGNGIFVISKAPYPNRLCCNAYGPSYFIVILMTSVFNRLIILFAFLAIFSGCVEDEAVSSLDTQLERTLIRLSENGTLEDYMLPDGSNLAGIPAGIGNPLTPEKIELGKLLFHETALGRDAIREGQLRTFSCATCHIAQAGFTAGAAQGIADGGVGFGDIGRGRTMAGDYVEDEIDAQG
ncbi:MAG: cytochrome c peroxidase, partial [Bacteroidota bacterium]